MPNYKSYPTKKAVPSRMTRKHDRNKIFMANKKAKKVEKEARKSL